MAVLKLERGRGAGTSFFIDEQATIGRDASQATVHIADQKASRVHSRIFKKKDFFYLEDLQSKNGTFLNGKPLTAVTKLEPGDYIRIGFTWISFGEELEIERIGKELPAYEILQEIGDAGGTGLSFKVRQVGLDRMVTLNLLPPNIIRNNPQLKQRFRQQASALGKLNHENVAIMLDFEAKESYLYFTTEYVDGEHLSARLKRMKKLSLINTLEIVIGIARGLHHAHIQNVLHQDANPSNVMICGRRVILGGFGVASVLSEVQDHFSGLIGQAEYLSPEQVLKQKIDARSDIYSLGIIFYEMLAGRPPFVKENPEDLAEAVVNDPPAAITSYNPDIPAEVEDLIYQCLEKEPDQRPESCEKLANKLEEILMRQKVVQLQKAPGVYTSGVLYFFIQLMETPLWAWCFFPFLSLILLFILSLMIR